ncbi:unnamed protein product [Heterosigma akashiwo]
MLTSLARFASRQTRVVRLAPGACSFHTSVPVNGSAYTAQHRYAPDNNPETFFDFTDANYKKVDKILGKYPKNFKKGAIIPLLDLAQRQHRGWLRWRAMDKVA